MHHIIVSGLTVDIVRKDIKNLHLGVYPPDGRVRVAAPLRLMVPWCRRHLPPVVDQTPADQIRSPGAPDGA
jgi:hypothetical protein